MDLTIKQFRDVLNRDAARGCHVPAIDSCLTDEIREAQQIYIRVDSCWTGSHTFYLIQCSVINSTVRL